jgi:hypothetical protein
MWQVWEGREMLWDSMGKHEEKSPIGRPRLRWDDSIKVDLNKGRIMRNGLI